MRIELIKNYLPLTTCQQLSQITQYGRDNNLMTLGFNTSLRYTSRIKPELYTYPQIVFDLAAQVRQYCGVSTYPVEPTSGQDGIVTTHMPTNADIFKYKSGTVNGQAELWAFIVTQQPESGGNVLIDDVEYIANVGDLLVYATSNSYTYTTPVLGTTPRICWSFGNLVPSDAWESGQIIVGG
jgi:hypothetical protein